VAIDLQRIITILELKNIVRVKNHRKQSRKRRQVAGQGCAPCPKDQRTKRNKNITTKMNIAVKHVREN
jgi:hypothetical protein